MSYSPHNLLTACILNVFLQTLSNSNHAHEDECRVHVKPFECCRCQLRSGQQLRAGEADVTDSGDDASQQRHAGTVEELEQLGERVEIEPF